MTETGIDVLYFVLVMHLMLFPSQSEELSETYFRHVALEKHKFQDVKATTTEEALY
jgi:hypothetical protein